MTTESRNSTTREKSIEGTRAVVAAFGILCGLTGMIAGVFEILQGNIVPSGLVISTIGPDHTMAADFTYFAITIIPNLLVTGILAVALGSFVTYWSIKGVQKPYGVVILAVLCAAQTLVGGGWVVDIAAITCILATRIGKPLNWWRSHMPGGIRTWLVRLLPASLVAYALVASGLLVLTVLGIDSAVMIELITVLAGFMFVPMLLMIFGGLATDVQAALRSTNADSGLQ